MAEPSDFGGLFVGPGPSRILVTGANGAGKTVLARRLAAELDLPVHHKDALALKTGWQHRPPEESLAETLRLAAHDRWIIEGGPSILDGGIIARATHVIWIDLPPGLRVRRILWRAIRHLGRTRSELPPGNREGLGPRQWTFMRKAYSHHGRVNHWILAQLDGFDGPVIRLTSQSAVSALREAAGERAKSL